MAHPNGNIAAASGCCAALLLCRSGRKRCSRELQAPLPRCPWPEPMEETMRGLSRGELSRCTRPELAALLRRIAAELPRLAEGPRELRNAHITLQNIRRALARPELRA